ncbi:MAG: CRTAC1 family protein [Phycisphaerales bacterium]|nr:CRTAC1 family protein [Phycisphaerales bacterium]
MRWWILLASLPMACDGTLVPLERVDLVDVTDQSGLQFVTTCGSDPSTQIVEVNGPGVCLLDADGDGDLDVFIANGATIAAPEDGPGSKLFRNLLRESGKLQFQDATTAFGIDITRWATSATAADFDADGDQDLYVTCIGSDILLRNDDSVFVDITHEAGIDVPDWSTGAAIGDVDGDGDLDVYVTRYVAWDFSAPPVPSVAFRGQDVLSGPAGLTPLSDTLLLNQGNCMFLQAPLPAVTPSFGLNAVILDLNGDGRGEILVGNDGMNNQLLDFDNGRGWKDTAQERGFATNMAGSPQATMGLAIGDVTSNGEADVFSSNFSSDTNTLLVQETGDFIDRTNAYAIGSPSRSSLGWTSRFIDLDHDGDEDLLTLNGHVYPNATAASMDSTYRQRPLVLLRDGNRFTPLRASTGWLAGERLDRAAAFGDLDRDGDLDLVTAELHGSVRVIENQVAPGTRQGIIIRLRDELPGSSNPDAIGARITAWTGDTDLRAGWILPTSPFQGCSAPQWHTSVKVGEPKIFVRVLWPDGKSTRHAAEVKPEVTIQRPPPSPPRTSS